MSSKQVALLARNDTLADRQEWSGEQEWSGVVRRAGVARSGQEWSGEQEPEDQDNCYPGEADKMSGRLINH